MKPKSSILDIIYKSYFQTPNKINLQQFLIITYL